MSTLFTFRSLLLTAGCWASLASIQAQTAPEPAPAVVSTTATGFKPATLLKLGTGLTRHLVLGPGRGIVAPVVLGAEHRFAPAWSVYGNATGLWHVGKHAYYQEHNPGILFTGLAVDLGVRHYYNQAKRQARGRATGAFVGNYLAVQANADFIRYDARLHHETSSVVALWGLQRRLGRHGLLDAYGGFGVEALYWASPVAGVPLSPSIELGLKISLVH